MGVIVSLGAVLGIVVIALMGAQMHGMQYLFGVLIPYVAFATFLVGFVLKVVNWGKSPVPFRIPTTAGQAKSLPWIKQNKIDNPSSTFGVVMRMAFEVLLFRSLFRNTKAEFRSGNLSYGPTKWLWLFALLFHYGFFIIAFRHLRLFMEPVPWFVTGVDTIDGMLQIGAPPIYLSDLLILAGVTFLFFRRLVLPKIRYMSLPADYFPLVLIFAIAVSGILMRFVFRVDIVGAKAVALGLATLHPTIPEGIGAIFFVHVTLVSVLLAYFPFSKLMHLGGVFLSPTRNLANNNREVRHVNPWNYAVKRHTYDEYEDEFREAMKEAGIPVEKE